MKRLLNFMTIGLLFTVILTSCTDENFNDAKNSFKVRMTDSPGNYAALNLEIVGVDVYQDGQGWVNLSSQTQFINVLTLVNGNEMVLANSIGVNAGLYTMIKIRFGNQADLVVNSGLLGGGVSSTHTLMWDGPREVQIAINEEVSAQGGANILLDFNVAQSVYQNADQYFIQPVVTQIKDITTGAQGTVQGSAMAAIILTNGDNTYSTYISATGQFLLRGVEPGTYNLTVDPVEEGLSEQHMDNIVIVNGQIYQAGNIQM